MTLGLMSQFRIAQIQSTKSNVQTTRTIFHFRSVESALIDLSTQRKNRLLQSHPNVDYTPTDNKIITMETKNMSANPHSIVHARQYNDVEKTKQEEQAPRKAEPGVKGVVRLYDGFGSFQQSSLLQ
jgi:hypothetical protein